MIVSGHSLRFSGLLGLILLPVRFYSRRYSVGLDDPDPSVFEVLEEGTQVSAGNLASPDDLGCIDVSGVVNPFVEYVVIGAIVHKHKLSSRQRLKLVDYLSTLIAETLDGVKRGASCLNHEPVDGEKDDKASYENTDCLVLNLKMS